MEAYNGRGRKEGAESSSRRLSKSRAFFDPARNPKQSQLEIVPTAKPSNASALAIERYSFGRTWFAWYLFFRGLFSNNFFFAYSASKPGKKTKKGRAVLNKEDSDAKRVPSSVAPPRSNFGVVPANYAHTEFVVESFLRG